MLSLYRTLSLRYLSRRWFRAVLIVASIALGVATLVATRALNETMSRAAVHAANPMAGVVDFVVTNGDLRVSLELVPVLAKVPGVASVSPRLFENATLVQPGAKERMILIMGFDLMEEAKKQLGKKNGAEDEIKLSPGTEGAYTVFRLAGQIPVIVGKQLFDDLPGQDPQLQVKNAQGKISRVVRAGFLEAGGAAAALSGFTLITDLSSAARILGIPEGKANRLDLVLQAGADPEETRRLIERALDDKDGIVRTPQQQDDSLQSVMAGMQTGFSLCGAAALVVGLFLVYNSLSVSVAERRHEIGVLLSLGATRDQVLRLIAGEAAILGLTGAILGVPLGVLLANLGLEPVREILNEIFTTVNAQRVEVSTWLLVLSLFTGVLTAVGASLVPAIQASRENPAEAVRRVPKAATLHHLLLQATVSAVMILVGSVMMIFRADLPGRLGTYGGLMIVLIGALVASPFLAALAARLLQPLARNFLSIEWRLAADNLVRSPGRTGLVIGALAAGVSLVVQTAGTIRSNRVALRDWVQESIGCDVIVTKGGLVGAGGQIQPMDPALAAQIETIPGIEAVLPVRMCDVEFRDTKIRIMAIDAAQAYVQEKKRLSKGAEIELYKKLAEEPNGILMSENFAALYQTKVGDVITLPRPGGKAQLKIIGMLTDYSWNKGSLLMNRPDFLYQWNDPLVSVFDVYLHQRSDDRKVKEQIAARFGAQFELQPITRSELQAHIDDMIERLYGIAYGQQFVVMVVAGLGVVTALLISVLQRRREMGLLRAIGASRGQVIYSVLAEACLMGIIGTAIGLAVGIPLQWYVLKVVILEESGFLFPVLIPWLGGLIIGVVAMATATLAGLGPAMYAVRQRIPDAIAYE